MPDEKDPLHPLPVGRVIGGEPIVDMSVFRAEIATLIAERKKEHINMIELIDIDPDDLTTLDAIMWYKVNHYTKGLITSSQFKVYRANIQQSGNASRRNFQAVIANKLQVLWGREELEQNYGFNFPH